MAKKKGDAELMLKIAADGTQATGEIGKVKDAATNMGNQGAQATSKFNTELKKSGDEAGKNARAFGSLASQIKRDIVSMTTSLEGYRAGIEKAADFRKLSAAQRAELEPLLQQWTELRNRSDQAALGFQNVGLSSKQMQQAIRGLPAQFTDIWVSLATGQKPIMVLLQQGGQIKDMFGGIKPALMEVGKQLLALVNPITVTIAIVAALAYAYSEGAAEAMKLNKALIETGNSAGLTLNSLRGMAERMSEFGMTQGEAVDALEKFIRAGAGANKELEKFATTAVLLEKAGGQSVEKTAKAFADLAKQPYEATLKLTEGMNYLHTAELEQINALEQIGLKTEAARVAQQAYGRGLQDMQPQMKENLGYMERAWNAIAGAVKKAWDWIKEIGREGDPVARMSAELIGLEAVLQRMKDHNLDNYMGMSKAQVEDRIAQLRNEQYAATEMIRLGQQQASLDAQRAKRNEALAKWHEIEKKHLSDKLKMERDINEAIIIGVAAGKTSLEIVKEINAIREDYAKKGGKDPNALSGEQGWMKELAKTMEQAAASAVKYEAETAKLTKSQEALLKVISDPRWAATPEHIKQWFLEFMYGKIAVEQVEQALQDLAKWQEKQERLSAKSYETYQKETEALEEKAKKLQIEAEAIRLGVGAKQELTAVAYRLAAAQLEEWRTSQLVYGASEADLVLVDARIQAYKNLADEMDNIADAKKEDAVKKGFDKITESVENSLTDALMRGFESGKGFLDNLLDAIRNGFKTLVVKFLIEPVMKGFAGGLVGGFASAFGAGAAGAATGSSGATDFGSSLLGGIVGKGSLAGTIASGFGTGFSGTIAGFSELGMGGFASSMADIAGFASYGGVGGWSAAAGAAAPYVLAALAIYAAYKKWRKNGGSPAQQSYSYLDQAGNVAPNPWGASLKNVIGENAFDEILQPVVVGVGATAKALGGSPNQNLRYGLYTSVSPDGKGGQTVAEVAEFGKGVLYDYNVNGPNDTVQQRIEDQIPRLFLVGLQNSDIDQVFKDYFAQFDVETVTQDQVNAAVETAIAARTMAEATEALGGSFLQLANISVEARSNILALSGGLDSFLQKTATYLDLYYSESEKAAIQAYNVAKTLTTAGISIEGLDTPQEFRQIVESLDLSTTVGQAQLAALLEVAPAFYSLTTWMKENQVDLNQLSGGIFKFNPGWNIIAGPGELTQENYDAEYDETAPWLPALKEAWAGAMDTHMTNLNTALTEAGTKTAQAITDVGTVVSSAVSNAVAAVSDRPIEVIVRIDGAEVNGGVIS